jgi:hypothetical protein
MTRLLCRIGTADAIDRDLARSPAGDSASRLTSVRTQKTQNAGGVGRAASPRPWLDASGKRRDAAVARRRRRFVIRVLVFVSKVNATRPNRTPTNGMDG